MSAIGTSSRRDFDENFLSPLWADAARNVCRHEKLAYSRLERAASSDHVVFVIDDKLVLKIFRPSRNCWEREKKALEFTCGRLRFRTPEIVAVGRFEDLDYLVTTQIPGFPLARAEFLNLPEGEQVRILTELAAGLREIHEIDPSPFNDDWPAFVDNRAATFVKRQVTHGVNRRVIDALPAFIDDHLLKIPRMPAVFLHGDVHFGNLKFERAAGAYRISGLFDFADSRRGFHEYDLLAVGVLMIQGRRELQRKFLMAYGYSESELNEEMRARMMMMTMLYETSDLRRYALRLSPEAVDLDLCQLERAIWNFV